MQLYTQLALKALFFGNQEQKIFISYLNNLDQIIPSVPSLENRVNKSQVSAIGHSPGGLTVGMLAGAEMTDPN